MNATGIKFFKNLFNQHRIFHGYILTVTTDTFIPLDRFSRNLIFGSFLKICKKESGLIEIQQE
jgi:hypothetical protein